MKKKNSRRKAPTRSASRTAGAARHSSASSSSSRAQSGKKTSSAAAKKSGAKDKKTNGSDTLVLAYDVGGTKVSVAVVDQTGKILTSHREPILIKRGKEATLAQLVDLGQKMIDAFPQIKAVGVASAGPLNPVTGELLDPTNFTGPDGHWGKVPLAKILSQGLKRPVILENDAAAAMLAESWKGEAKGYENAMILTLGTGLGVGVIANGELVRGGRHQHTEGGHLILKAGDESAPCGCGNFGCAEAYLAGKTFTHRARKHLKNELIDAVQIAARARTGDREALALFEEYAEMMAIALNNFAVIYYPEIVVLTGSFAAAHDLFVKNTVKYLDKLLERRNQVMNLTPKIVISSLENQAGVLGGAYVALKSLGKV